jgi:hypothetical protein
MMHLLSTLQLKDHSGAKGNKDKKDEIPEYTLVNFLGERA